MVSWVSCNTPIIISKDKSYVEIMTIDALSEVLDKRTNERTREFYIWTPAGWEIIKNVIVKNDINDNLKSLVIVKNARNFVICSNSSQLLSSNFIPWQTWIDFIVSDNVVSTDNTNVNYEGFKQMNVDIHALIWKYSMSIMGVLDSKSCESGESAQLYECKFPESKIIDVEPVFSDKEADVDIDSGVSCDFCTKSIYGTYYNCIECSKERERTTVDICSSCFERSDQNGFKLIDYEDDDEDEDHENKKILHEASHAVQKFEIRNRMDFYNATDTARLQQYLYMEISNQLCYDSFNTKTKEIKHDIPSVRWSGNAMQRKYMHFLMDFEKLGYTDYNLSFKIENYTNGVDIMINFNMNFYPLLMIKYKTLFCHNVCYTINPKGKYAKYDKRKNELLKTFKKNIKKIYKEYIKEKGDVKDIDRHLNDEKQKKIEIYKSIDFEKPEDLEKFHWTFGLEENKKLYSIITKSGMWAAGVGRFVLYNKE